MFNILREYVGFIIQENQALSFAKKALEQKLPVNIPRSDGSMSRGLIIGIEDDYAFVQFPSGGGNLAQTMKLARKKVPLTDLMAANI